MIINNYNNNDTASKKQRKVVLLLFTQELLKYTRDLKATVKVPIFLSIIVIYGIDCEKLQQRVQQLLLQ